MESRSVITGIVVITAIVALIVFMVIRRTQSHSLPLPAMPPTDNAMKQLQQICSVLKPN